MYNRSEVSVYLVTELARRGYVERDQAGIIGLKSLHYILHASVSSLTPGHADTVCRSSRECLVQLTENTTTGLQQGLIESADAWARAR